MTTVTQRTFASGEISPSMYARVDQVKYATGLRTCKNMIVLRYGGASNRAGTKFVGEVSDSSKKVREIPFIFNAAQTYILEFGNLYMRVIKNGAHLTETPQAITGVTQANPAVVTIAGHLYSNGDEVFINSVSGMAELNNRNFKVANVAANTFELQEMDGTNLDSTGFGAYISSGTAAKMFEIVTPYLEAELPTLNYVQSADVVTLVHPSHAPADLSRSGDTSWALAIIDFAPSISAPGSVSATSGPAGSLNIRYQITSVSTETKEESLPGIDSSPLTVSGATQASPVVITSIGHVLSDGDQVLIYDIIGMTELNSRQFYVSNATANTFELEDVDGTTYTAYVSGGKANRTFAEIGAVGTPVVGNPHVVAWTQVSGAIEYNVYKEVNGVYGQIGVATGTSFDDVGIAANTSFTPPSSRNPFLGTGNYPSTVTYIQQRLGFASTNNNTEIVELSRSGNFKNFTKSRPSQIDDAITFNMAGRQVNAVKSLLDLGRFVILSSAGEWTASGDSAGILSPTQINLKQSTYNGSGDLQPIIIDGSAIYQQARGSILRDLGYDFQTEGYVGNDLTIFSAHLFDDFTLVDWAYQQVPHSILWVVRDDGVLLGMTFVRNQEVIAWHRHELSGGFVENVAVVPEGNEDSLYLTVRRTINGKTVRYIEQMQTRQITNVVDNNFTDSSLSFDGRNTNTAFTMTLSGGTTWAYDETITLTASAAFFLSTDVGNAIHLKGASKKLIRATITAFTSSTIVSVRPQKTVPIDLRATATNSWSKAVDELLGLWHLEGEDVSIFGDGFVVASPNNSAYETITVTDGKVTLDKPFAVIHVGLPYIPDFETLDIDTPSGETVSDKEKNISRVTMFIEDTRGIWIGPRPPSDDDTDPLEGLTELKIRDTEDYESPVSLKTDTVNINIEPEWNNNGRIFVRQVDPVPLSILSVSPAGKIPFSG